MAKKNSGMFRSSHERYFMECGPIRCVTTNYSPEEREIRNRELVKRIQDGEGDAFTELLQENTRLIVCIAERYDVGVIPPEDLGQEGTIALYKAAMDFDPTVGAPFSAYSWMRVDFALKKLVWEETQKKNGFVISSLDEPLGDDGDGTVADFVASENGEQGFREVELHATAENLLGTLSDEERKLVRMRVGLEDGDIHTLEEIGSILGMSKEGARQFYLRLYSKLRKAA